MNYLKISRCFLALNNKTGIFPRISYRFAVRLLLSDVDKAIAIVSQYQPFLVLSTGRAGTRWLADLLNQVPKTYVVHEPILDEQNAHVQAFMYPETSMKYLTGFRLAEMALRCRIHNPSIYGEVNSNLRRHAAAFKELVPDINIIHLVRDGRDVVRSIMSRKAFTQEDKRNLVPPSSAIKPQVWSGMSRFEKICWMWTYENSYLRHQADLTVRFEDIISHYGTFKSKVLLPLGLSLDRSIWENAVQRPLNNTKSFSIGLWNQWTSEQREQFVQICGQEMQVYGYEFPDMLE